MRRADDTGTTTVEFVVLTPLLLALLCFVAALGRITTAGGQVAGAARDAARAASLARTTTAARQAATDAARANLGGQGITCARLRVTADLRDFAPGGAVAVTVRCTTSLADLGLAGLPGTTTVSATELAPVDPNRGLR